MATYTLPLTGSLHKAVAGGSTDTVTVPAGRGPKRVKVTAGWSGVFVRGDGTAAVARADGTYYVAEHTDPAVITVQPGHNLSIVPWIAELSALQNVPYSVTIIEG